MLQSKDSDVQKSDGKNAGQDVLTEEVSELEYARAFYSHQPQEALLET